MDNSSVKNDHSVTGTKAVWISPIIIMVEENSSKVHGKEIVDYAEARPSEALSTGPS